MVKAVILDLDGTLVNSHPAHVESFKEMLRLSGLTVNRIDFSKYFGLIAEDILEKLFPNLTRKQVKNLALLKRRLFIKRLSLITTTPCANELITELAGKRTAIATSASRDEMEAIVKKFNWHFNALITSYEVPKPKPAPDILLAAVKQLRVKISDCLFIGDSIYDADTAINAGMKFIGVATGSFKLKDFSNRGVKAYPDLCCLLSSGELHNP